MPPETPRPNEPFGLTEQERLFTRISHQRLLALLDDDQTTIHQVELSANDYGEFLFVTLSQTHGDKRSGITFWGMGYHEYRERYLAKEWFWYKAMLYPKMLESRVSSDEAHARIAEQEGEIAPLIGRYQQSRRGVQYEYLADISDEDGAKTEIEDLGDDWFGE